MMTVENNSIFLEKNTPLYFGEEMPDGRLTANYDSTTFHFKDLLVKRNLLGRPLTKDEMKEFEIYAKN